MITKKAQEFISENSSSISLLLKVSDLLDVYHVDDDFETKDHDREYVVGAAARYKYLAKKRKGSPVPPYIELSDLEQLAESLLQMGADPIIPPAQNDIPTPQPNVFDMSNRPFVPNRVVIVPIERQTSAQMTDYLFHNNELLSGEGLRGVVDAYFHN